MNVARGVRGPSAGCTGAARAFNTILIRGTLDIEGRALKRIFILFACLLIGPSWSAAQITLDGSAHCLQFINGGGITSVSCTLTGVSLHDLITVEFYDHDGHMSSVSDGTNGIYTPTVYNFDASNPAYAGIAYFQNSAAGNLTVTLKLSQAEWAASIHAQAWKGAAVSGALDSGFLQALVSPSGTVANPSCGSSIVPATDGELILAFLQNDSFNAVTAGASYTLIDTYATNGSYPEYWIQTSKTATNGPFIEAVDDWVDTCAAFKPQTGSAASFSPPSLNFSSQNLNSTSSAQSVTLTNIGTTMSLSSVALQTGTQYAISSNTCGSILAPAGNCTVAVTFTPTSAGVKTDNIVFTDNASGSPQSVALSGTGIAATWAAWNRVSITPATGNLGTLNQKSVGTVAGYIVSWNGAAAAASAVILGNQTSTSSYAAYQNANFDPIFTGNGSAGYTLGYLNLVNDTSTAGNIYTGIYNTTTAGCPAGWAFCPGSLICSSPLTAAIVGTQTLTPTGCGTLASNSLYWLASVSNNSGVYYKHTTNFLCPNTAFEHTSQSVAGYPLPATAGATSPTSTCNEIYAQLVPAGTLGTIQIPWVVIDFAGAKSGSLVSAANLLPGTHGGISSFGEGTYGNMTYTNAQSQAFLTPVLVCGASCTSYSGSTGISVLRTNNTSDRYIWNLPQSTTGLSEGHWWKTDISAASLGNGNLCDLVQIGGYNDIVFQLGSDGTNLNLHVEWVAQGQNPSDGVLGNIPISSNTWYWLTLQNNSNTGSFNYATVYDTSGALVGSISSPIRTSTSGPGVANVGMGNGGSCATAPVAHYWYGPQKIDPTGMTYPVLP